MRARQLNQQLQIRRNLPDFRRPLQNNISANTTAESNPVIGLLSEFNKLWTPGKTWNTGTKLNSRVLDANIQKSWILLNAARCLRKCCLFDDRRSQSYSIIDGLGKLAGVYRMNAGATTTITSIPADASIRNTMMKEPIRAAPALNLEMS
ncbi:hypothetical protein PO124_32050 [Bacillus licheniformis]|nr:hypothetical protein [Bacillus licheniformis]